MTKPVLLFFLLCAIAFGLIDTWADRAMSRRVEALEARPVIADWKPSANELAKLLVEAIATNNGAAWAWTPKPTISTNNYKSRAITVSEYFARPFKLYEGSELVLWRSETNGPLHSTSNLAWQLWQEWNPAAFKNEIITRTLEIKPEDGLWDTEQKTKQ